MKQVVLWIGANAGGVSKTTLAVHIGYEMAKRGFDVALLDLDTNVSMSQFCGLDKDPPLEQTIAAVFSEDFDGNWPLLMPEWGKPKGKLFGFSTYQFLFIYRPLAPNDFLCTDGEIILIWGRKTFSV